jgi:cell division transport system permease protein
MSASSDRFPGRPEPAVPVSDYDRFDDAVTAIPTAPAPQPPAYGGIGRAGDSAPSREAYAPARSGDRGRKM